VGLTFAMVPFIFSLKPSASAGEALPHIDVSELKVGYYTVYDDTHLLESRDEAGNAYFILRDSEADFTVYWLPKRGGKYIMPHHYLPWYGQLCDDFGPDADEGQVVADGYFRCHDQKNNTEYHWKMDGTKLGKWTDDLYPVNWALSGRHLVIGKG